MQAYFGPFVFKQIYLEAVCSVRRYSHCVWFVSVRLFFLHLWSQIWLPSRRNFSRSSPFSGFFLQFGSVVKHFIFTVLPFRMSSTPSIFSKLVRTLVNYWRGLKRRVVTFLDDGIGGSPDYASCLVHSRLCRSDLESAGFFVNLQKSVWEPSQVGTWLCFHLDFGLNFITVPLPKITKLQESISRILALRFLNALLVSWTPCFWPLETLCV